MSANRRPAAQSSAGWKIRVIRGLMLNIVGGFFMRGLIDFLRNLVSVAGCVVAFSLGWATMAFSAQPVPRVSVVVDLLAAFDPSSVKDSLSCQVQRPSKCGGVAQDGLYEHPLVSDRPARVDYRVRLPEVKKGEVLLLAFDIGIVDGARFDRGEDGVRFVVELAGARVFAQEWRTCRWQTCAVDLTACAGREVQLGLLTEAMRNTSHDWSVWGSPRVLLFQDAAPIQTSQTQIAVGALALNYRPGSQLKVRLKPEGDGRIVEWQESASPATSESNQWVVLDFSFAEAAAVSWEPRAAVKETFMAPYPAQPVLEQLSVTRAVPITGEPLPIRVRVKNEGRGQLASGGAQVLVQVENETPAARSLPAMAPGETRVEEFPWTAPRQPKIQRMQAQLRVSGQDTPQIKTATFEVFPPADPGRTQVLENDQVRLEFVRTGEGIAYVQLFGRQNNRWVLTGVWRPLFRALLETRAGDWDWEVRPTQLKLLASLPARVETSEVQKTPAKASPSVSRLTPLEPEWVINHTHRIELRVDRPTAIELAATPRDPDGVAWEFRLRIWLETNRPIARLQYVWKASAERRVKALWGPNIYVGEGTTGEAKTWGLFPGLECLYGGERSSNPRDFSSNLADRRTPHPYKITLPLMAVSVGDNSAAAPDQAGRFFSPDSLKDAAFAPATTNEPMTVALFWDPMQKWDGIHAFPSARFASPNFDEGMRNHRLALFLPSVPDFVAENADRATVPYRMKAGQRIQLQAGVILTPGPVNAAVREWYSQSGGLPQPHAWPRSFEAELAVCRQGFLKTVWDAPNEKWRHCIDWPGSHAPGFAALLWMDSAVTQDQEGKRLARERVDLAVKNMLRDGGADGLVSSANCHIMRWELPFLYGYLPEALNALEPQIQQLIRSQSAEGGWLFHPANADQQSLGQAGDSVLGINAQPAATLLRYARVTGDRSALAAGEKALAFMERFRVPRGGQTWECPMYEPDILPAGWAVAAYLDGYRATGHARWLQDAVYWAESGLPFIYHWTLPDKPMMLGATIPVLGSTFYTHTWLATPVQWCGLVYAYQLQHLAGQLERTPLTADASPLPVRLNFRPEEWRRVAESIAVSAMYQQYSEGDRVGSYPDSISQFEKRNPAFINPEDILVNLLALKGFDPDIKTIRLTGGQGECVISSGAAIEQARFRDNTVQFQLRYFRGEPSHCLVVGFKPREVRVAGVGLPESQSPVRRDPGWWWDAARHRLFLTVPHETETVEVVLVGKPDQ